MSSTEEDTTSSVVNIETENSITGFHLIPSCENNPDEPPCKQAKESLEVHSRLQTYTFTKHLIRSWKDSSDFTEDDVELIANPFRTYVVRNFFEDDTILNKALEEFNELEWNRRTIDLYEFYQSSDLKHVNSKYISKVYECLKNDVKSWVQLVTGLQLSSISATCSLYSDTDYLLVHDDQQEDRVVAFVLYLMEPREWLESYGGALQLFCKDTDGQPYVGTREILPRHNQFVFFQVTSDSYHQVTEVMNKNDCRMSINGWFHYKAKSFATPMFQTPPRGLFSSHVIRPEEIDISLDSWINSSYLEKETINDIQQHIEEHCEISLHKFFTDNAMDEILEQVRHGGATWNRVGPPNRFLYEVAVVETLPELAQRFLKLFSSPKMFTLLHQYSDLDLKTMRYELQRWRPGFYSLLADYDWSKSKELDVILYFGCSRTNIVGGRIMYISLDEEIQEALVTIEPEENCLNIVFRDTARITKYVSKYSTCTDYFLLICSYAE